MTSISFSVARKRFLLIILVSSLLSGCVLVRNADLRGVRLFLGSPSWPLESGVYSSETSDDIMIERTVSRGGERVYELSINGGNMDIVALYPRDTRDWYILEIPAIDGDGSNFVYVKVFDAGTIAIFNSVGNNCQNYSATNYAELIANLNIRYNACPDVSDLYQISRR